MVALHALIGKTPSGAEDAVTAVTIPSFLTIAVNFIA